MKIYIDTCVIIDYLQDERSNHNNADKAIILALKNKYELFISAKSITDVYYISFKELHNKKKTIETISEILDYIDILDTSKDNILSALKSSLPNFEDAVAIDTAISNSMDMVITTNKKDFKQNLIKVYTPEEFINKIS